MEDKIVEGYKYSFFESTSPLYLDDILLLNVIKNNPYFEINSRNCEDFYDPLELFIDKYSNFEKTFVIIDTDNIDLTVQARLVGLVKDRTYKTLDLPSNCKLIVIGNHETMNKELFGLLTVL